MPVIYEWWGNDEDDIPCELGKPIFTEDGYLMRQTETGQTLYANVITKGRMKGACLPKYFSDASGRTTSIKVPQKYHKQYARFMRDEIKSILDDKKESFQSKPDLTGDLLRDIAVRLAWQRGLSMYDHLKDVYHTNKRIASGEDKAYP